MYIQTFVIFSFVIIHADFNGNFLIYLSNCMLEFAQIDFFSTTS